MLPGGISLGLSSQYVSFLTSYRFVFFFFNDTATTEIYTLSLHDALPICHRFAQSAVRPRGNGFVRHCLGSEEHTSELQSHSDLVCRLLLEKKKPRKKAKVKRKKENRRTKEVTLCLLPCAFCLFFFNDTATTEIYTLSLHDALPIFPLGPGVNQRRPPICARRAPGSIDRKSTRLNSSHTVISYAVFCLKKKKTI